MRFAYTIIHVPGKELYTADTLSRTPVGVSNVDVIEDLTEEVEAFVNVVMQGFPATDNRIEEIRQHQLQEKDGQRKRILKEWCDITGRIEHKLP